MNKKIIRTFIFLLITFVCALYLTQVFSYPRTDDARKTFNSFYNEEKNSVDGVYFGASSANRYWIGAKAFNDQGIAITSLATTNQLFVTTKYLMEEAKKTQDPELFIIEMRWLHRSPDSMGDEGLRRVSDSMKFSANRIKMINAAVDFASKGENSVSQNKIEYYFSFLKYHDRWNSGNLTSEDLMLKKPESECKGFLLTRSSIKIKKQSEAEYTSDTDNMDINTEKILLDFLDYCDKQSAEVLFVSSPYSAYESELSRINMAEKIITERGYKVLNFNTEEMIETLNIDWEKDFYDNHHVNLRGAEKYTDYLTDYIVENYDLEDHREDSRYQSWHDAFKYYTEFKASRAPANW